VNPIFISRASLLYIFMNIYIYASNNNVDVRYWYTFNIIYNIMAFMVFIFRGCCTLVHRYGDIMCIMYMRRYLHLYLYDIYVSRLYWLTFTRNDTTVYYMPTRDIDFITQIWSLQRRFSYFTFSTLWPPDTTVTGLRSCAWVNSSLLLTYLFCWFISFFLFPGKPLHGGRTAVALLSPECRSA